MIEIGQLAGCINRTPWALPLYVVLGYVCLRCRDKSWIVALWIPLLAGGTTILGMLLLQHFKKPGAYHLSPDTLNYLGALVICVIATFGTLAALARAHPPRRFWTARFLAIGLAAAASVPFALVAGIRNTRNTGLSVVFAVVDQDGMPMDHVSFLQECDWHDAQFTDKKGLLEVHSVFDDRLGGLFLTSIRSQTRVIVELAPEAPGTFLLANNGGPLEMGRQLHPEWTKQVSASSPIRVEMYREKAR